MGTHVKTVRVAINGSKHVYRDVMKTQHALISNPIPSRIYGLVKVHKEAAPIRPVVSFISTPTYQLAKDLDAWIK